MRYLLPALLFAALVFPGGAEAAPVRTAKVLRTTPTAATYVGRAIGPKVRRGGVVRAEWYRGAKVRVSWGPYRHRWVSKKAFERRWRSGTCSWYDIADNTPPGSRATSSGKRLGWGGGWTFASRHFALGTVLLIKGRNGRVHKATCTDRGGLRTIDLYRPAYRRFGNSDRFKYVVVRRGW